MGTLIVDATILCGCGQHKDAAVHQGGGHAYRPMRGPDLVRDNQEVIEGERYGHSTVVEQAIITLAKPAAGVDWKATVPTPASWRINAVQCQLVADAVVANRVPHIVVTDGQGNSVWNFPATQNQVAASTVQYSAAPYAVTAFFDGAQVMVLPAPLTLLHGWTVGMVTTGLDVGDQWSNIVLYVKRWLNF